MLYFLLLLFCECSSLLVLRLALSFSLIFCSELVSLLMSSSLILMFIIYESYFNIWLAVEKFHAYSGANGSLCRLRHRLCMSCRYCSHYELVNYAHIMTSLKYLRVSIVPLKVSCIAFSIASIILWYIFSCKCFNWVTWRMLASCYDYTLVTLSLYEHLVFDLCITLCFDKYILSLCMIMAIMLS